MLNLNEMYLDSHLLEFNLQSIQPTRDTCTLDLSLALYVHNISSISEHKDTWEGCVDRIKPSIYLMPECTRR